MYEYFDVSMFCVTSDVSQVNRLSEENEVFLYDNALFQGNAAD